MSLRAHFRAVACAGALGACVAALLGCTYPDFEFRGGHARSANGAGGEGGSGDGGAGGAGGATGEGGTGGRSPTSTTSGGGGAGGGAGGGEVGAGGSPPLCGYDSPNDCGGAVSLCTLRGDTGGDVCTTSGTTSKWVKVLVHEAVNSLVEYPALSYTATLQSPPGMDYDLYVYTGNIDAPDCGAPADFATGEPESFAAEWDDTFNHDDDRWIALEVRHYAGHECGEAAEWTLTVAGNVP